MCRAQIFLPTFLTQENNKQEKKSVKKLLYIFSKLCKCRAFFWTGVNKNQDGVRFCVHLIKWFHIFVYSGIINGRCKHERKYLWLCTKSGCKQGNMCLSVLLIQTYAYAGTRIKFVRKKNINSECINTKQVLSNLKVAQQ